MRGCYSHKLIFRKTFQCQKTKVNVSLSDPVTVEGLPLHCVVAPYSIYVLILCSAGVGNSPQESAIFISRTHPLNYIDRTKSKRVTWVSNIILLRVKSCFISRSRTTPDTQIELRAHRRTSMHFSSLLWTILNPHEFRRKTPVSVQHSIW